MNDIRILKITKVIKIGRSDKKKQRQKIVLPYLFSFGVEKELLNFHS